MRRPKLKELDLPTLEKLVKECAKQRFTMRGEPTGDGGVEELWIRANQGHSLEVSSWAIVVRRELMLFRVGGGLGA